MSSNMTSPFADRLSRRSRYEALVSKYEAAAEVVRTHADTDVQLQPQDQPIAEEEPQLRHSPQHRREAEVQLEIYPALHSTPSRAAAASGRISMGGMPSLPLTPGSLLRRGGSATGIPGTPRHGPAPGDLEDGGSAGGHLGQRAEADGGDADDEKGNAEREGGGGGGGLAAGITGALGGLASLAGLHLGPSGGAEAAEEGAADGAAADEAQIEIGMAMGLHGRSHRKHRSERAKKQQPGSTNWLKVDLKGMDTVIRVDKHKLMHKLGVQARDLRLLDLSSATPPAILGRDKAIIVNLWYIKAIITLDYCLVVSPDSIGNKLGSQAVEGFVTDLKAKLSTDRNARSYVGLANPSQVTLTAGYGSLQLPFELKVLEVCLDRTAVQLDQATQALEGDAYPNLDALTHKVTSANLEKARRIKNRLVRLTKDVESVREVLERFLNDDGDMHRLHLTGAELSRQVSMKPTDLGRLSAGLLPASTASQADSDSSSDSSIDEAETAAVEMLLEAYFMQFDHTFNRLQTVDEYIKDTEDLVTIKLDQHRNQLITIDLVLTCFTTALALMTVVGGYFGMNLDSGLQEAAGLFNAVVLTTTFGSLALFGGFMLVLHRNKLLYF